MTEDAIIGYALDNFDELENELAGHLNELDTDGENIGLSFKGTWNAVKKSASKYGKKALASKTLQYSAGIGLNFVVPGSGPAVMAGMKAADKIVKASRSTSKKPKARRRRRAARKLIKRTYTRAKTGKSGSRRGLRMMGLALKRYKRKAGKAPALRRARRDRRPAKSTGVQGFLVDHLGRIMPGTFRKS